MGRIRFALTNIIFWPTLIVSVFFIENVALLTAGLGGLEDLSFYLLGGFILFMLLVYYCLEHGKNKLKVDWILLVVFVAIFACGMFAIWSNPESVTGLNDCGEYPVNYEVIISTKEKVFNSIRFGITLIILYTFLFAQSRKTFRFKGLMWFCYIYLLYHLFTVAYSLITEFDMYKAILSGQFTGEIAAKSLYMNENTFGSAMLSAIVACAVINIRKSRWWSYLLIVIFYSAIIFSTCVTAVIVGSVFLLIYFSCEIFRGMKKHPIVMSLVLVLFISFVIALAILIAYSSNHEDFFFTPLVNYIDQLVSKKDFSSFSGRQLVWDQAFLVLKDDPLHLIFGRGFGFVDDFLNSIDGARSDGFSHLRSCHSGFLQILFSHGLIGLALYGLCLLYFIYCCIRLVCKKHVKFGLYFIFFTITISMRSIVESTYFMNLSVGDFSDTFIVFMPPMLLWKQYKHPKLIEEIKTSNVWQNSIKPKHLIRTITSALLGLLIVLLLPFSTPFLGEEQGFKDAIMLVISFVGVALIFVPYLISLWYRKSTDKRFMFRLIFYGILVSGISFTAGYFTARYVYNTMYWITAYFALCLLVLNLIYMPIYRGSFKEWFKNSFLGIFFTPHLSTVLTIGGGVLVLNLVYSANLLNFMNLAIISVLIYAFYLLLWLLVPFKETKTIIDEFNKNRLFKMRRDVFKEEL